jgi:hypothetical protein
MNVVFVLYESYQSNSAVHLHYLANNLVSLGARCAVAVPYPPFSSPGLGQQSYRVFDFNDKVGLEQAFKGEKLSVVHAWTPRENVRKYCDDIARMRTFKLVVHLEDNEDAILDRYFRRHGFSLMSAIQRRLGMVPETLSHPSRFRDFVASAQGVSIIVAALREFVPPQIPWSLFSPGVDSSLFYPRGSTNQWREKHKLPTDRLLLGYSGNVNWANANEVASVYEAAEWMTRNGKPTSVLRTGRNLVPFPWPKAPPGVSEPLELGYVEYQELPEILACADVLVQPGTADEFNSYRLPSKLPEYLAMGKPVILPRANVGELLKDGMEALVLPNVEMESIVRAATTVSEDSELRQALGWGAAKFALRHFNWRRSASGLLAFYETLT